MESSNYFVLKAFIRWSLLLIELSYLNYIVFFVNKNICAKKYIKAYIKSWFILLFFFLKFI